MAQAWAEKCSWNHGQAAQTPSQLGYSYVGQNLYAISGTSSINITNAVLRWYDEIQYYDYQLNSCQQGEVCGHYTQVNKTRFF